jgi:hypothetical protein
MKQHPNPFRLVLALGVLALSAAGCQGGTPSTAQYMPTSTGAPAALTSGIAIPDKKKSKIVSSCGQHIKIVLLGILDCRFHEPGYSGSFTITNNTDGLISISPTTGDKKTIFTVTGLLLGSGNFKVEDSHGVKLKIFVKVHTL